MAWGMDCQGQEETLEGHGYVHYLDGFTGVEICQNLQNLALDYVQFCVLGF